MDVCAPRRTVLDHIIHCIIHEENLKEISEVEKH